ncbi:MAG: TetR/AcrR family transcriptional regulator, partial [Actinobacteria bacterium]|nr:TetR/AcrR family transcriptional regulator [Actinomycetota bacterium]
MTTAEAREAGGRQRWNRRQEVLEAAIRVFHKKGYASASIQD